MAQRRSDISSTVERPYRVGPVEDPLDLPEGEQFITRGILLRNRRGLVLCGIIVLLAASILSYFVKPKPIVSELVSPAQEFAEYEAKIPNNNQLAQRVMDSYSLAFVLFETPYTAKNVRALESVRSWAQERFKSSPDFLHPVRLSPEQEPNDTVVGALGYNLFAPVKYFLEAGVGEFLRNRIADFHDEPAYVSFSEAYFEIYGRDSESATLLAKYQSEKAKTAIPVLLWSLAWAVVGMGAMSYVAFSPKRQRFERIRHSLVMVWFMATLAYGSSAWMKNSIPDFLSGLMAAALTLYFLKPFLLLTRQDSSLKVYFIQLSSRWLALSVWASYSLMAITTLTWIRCTLDQADPVSLLLSGLSGNFLSDPEDGKRLVARLLGIVWLLVSSWAFLQKDKDARISDELDDELASL